MGQLALPASGPVYVDTSAVIYEVERIEPYRAAGAPLWDALQAGSIQVVTSQITLLEVLVKPLRDGNPALQALYQKVLFGTAGLTALPISVTVLQRAAEVRAATALRTPDAIHASALDAACSLFVTNDPAFRKAPGLSVAVLGEVAAS